MADKEITYDQLNPLGQCIVNKKMQKIPKEAQTLSIRDISAGMIDTYIAPFGGHSESTYTAQTSKNKNGKPVIIESSSKVQTYTYEPDVAECVGQLKPNLPLTGDSVRKRPSPAK